MNKWIFYASIFFAVVTISCVVITGYYYKQHQNDHARLNQVEAILQLQNAIMSPRDLFRSEPAVKIDSLTRLLEVQEAKEDYYLNQLGVLSDWFILYVTALFGVIALFGFFSFRSIEAKVNEQEKKFEENFERVQNTVRAINAEFHKLMGNIYSSRADIYSDIGNKENEVIGARLFSILNYTTEVKIIGLDNNSKKALDQEIDSIFEIIEPDIVLHTKAANAEMVFDSIRKSVENIQDPVLRRRLFDLEKRLRQVTQVEG